jgi:ATP-dependent Clp protease ATP-binding subunit ClpB
MTSNLGSQELAEQDLNESAIRTRVDRALKTHFRPEFLNRIDDTIVFHRLTRESLGAIVEIQLDRLAARLSDRGIGIEVSPEAKAALARDGYDPIYGARPLKRLIEREVQNPIARRMLEGEIGAGHTILVEVEGQGLRIEARPKATERA